MQPVRTLALGAVLAGPLALMAVGCTPPKPYANCGAVDQAPNSDVGASQIQAHGTDCATARTLADQDYRHADARTVQLRNLALHGCATERWSRQLHLVQRHQRCGRHVAERVALCPPGSTCPDPAHGRPPNVWSAITRASPRHVARHGNSHTGQATRGRLVMNVSW